MFYDHGKKCWGKKADESGYNARYDEWAARQKQFKMAVMTSKRR